MSKAKRVTTIVIACLFALLSVVAIFWYFGESYSQFYSRATKEFEIAGLSSGFTPQGLTHNKTEDLFLMSGYMKNGSASRIYVVDAKKKTAEKYFTLKVNGQAYTGHAGGIAINNTYLWVVGDGMVYTVGYNQIMEAENGESIDVVSSFKSNNGADFVTIQDNYLWVGEFHREGKYDTDPTHEFETESGAINKAVSFKYLINDDKPHGLESTRPIMALSTPSLVQGMEFVDNKIILSTSYSLPNSHILFYNDITIENIEQTFTYETGYEIPLHVLDKTDLKEDFETPCMSEEIVVRNGRLFILFESACQKYGMVTREPLRNVYSIEV